MASRREFLQVGLASLALPISAHAVLSPGVFSLAGEQPSTPLYKVVFDERFAESRAFAREAKSLGATVHGIKADMTDLWYHDLYARWKKGPAAIAGMTAYGAIFCLERLAWDQQMRVVFRVQHSYRPNGHIEHALAVPDSMMRRTAALNESGTDWASQMASLVTRCPAGLSASQAEASKKTLVVPRAKSANDAKESLISWVISPVIRA